MPRILAYPITGRPYKETMVRIGTFTRREKQQTLTKAANTKKKQRTLTKAANTNKGSKH
jgi:hypothetical protein